MAAVLALTTAALDAFVGKSIEDICPHKYGKVGDAENHCAHFVSHVLKLNDALGWGQTCATMTFEAKKLKDKGAGACLRVNDIFNQCADLAAADENGCLVFFTLASNLNKDGLMLDGRKKHVGIYYSGHIWNYGNKKDAVRKDTLSDLEHLYGKTTKVLYTEIADSATLLSLSDIQALIK